jgi:c-di-AMP phosphodiesterase-like protein
MTSKKIKRVLALLGVALILILFILTIVFLLIGNSTLAITFVAINGFVTVILYFLLRFHQNAVESNADFIVEDKDPSQK